MGTLRRVGAIEPGLLADLVAVDVPDWVSSADEALGWIVSDRDSQVLRSWVGGDSVDRAV